MKVKKNELEDFLDEIRFITDDTPLPSSEVFRDSHTHMENCFDDYLLKFICFNCLRAWCISGEHGIYEIYTPCIYNISLSTVVLNSRDR